MLGVLLSSAMYRGQLCCPSCHASVLNIIFRYASQTHYQVLGIKKNASQAEIRSAFLEKSKKLHPDVNSQDSKSHDKFVKVNEAYSILSKPLQRREYDMTLGVRLHTGRQARATSSSHHPGYSTSSSRDHWFYSPPSQRHRYRAQRMRNAAFVSFILYSFMLPWILMWITIESYQDRELHKKMQEANNRRIAMNLQKALANRNTSEPQIIMTRANKKPLPDDVDESTLQEVVNNK